MVGRKRFVRQSRLLALPAIALNWYWYSQHTAHFRSADTGHWPQRQCPNATASAVKCLAPQLPAFSIRHFFVEVLASTPRSMQPSIGIAQLFPTTQTFRSVKFWAGRERPIAAPANCQRTKRRTLGGLGDVSVLGGHGSFRAEGAVCKVNVCCMLNVLFWRFWSLIARCHRRQQSRQQAGQQQQQQQHSSSIPSIADGIDGRRRTDYLFRSIWRRTDELQKAFRDFDFVVAKKNVGETDLRRPRKWFAYTSFQSIQKQHQALCCIVLGRHQYLAEAQHISHSLRLCS